jgi:hypothetical protein
MTTQAWLPDTHHVAVLDKGCTCLDFKEIVSEKTVLQLRAADTHHVAVLDKGCTCRDFEEIVSEKTVLQLRAA